MSHKSQINRLRESKRTVESGGVNCIPCPFNRFKFIWPGVTWKRYYIVSGGTKSSKTQFASNVFLYNTILYAYYNPDKIDLKIRYYPLEEDENTIIDRFYCFLLRTFYSIRINLSSLESLDGPLPDEILNKLEEDTIADIADYFMQTVKFVYEGSSTSIQKDIDRFAEENGKVTYNEKHEMVKYEPYNKKTLMMTFTDHISMLQCSASETLKSAIDRLDSKFVQSRNICNMTHVVVQQQNQQTASLESFKLKKIEPTYMGLADSTSTGKSCDIMFGIVNPYFWELDSYLKYNIKGGLGDNCRFVKVVLARKDVTASGSYLSLFFDGACAYFKELPKSGNTEEMEKIYKYAKTLVPAIKSDGSEVSSIVSVLLSKVKKLSLH